MGDAQGWEFNLFLESTKLAEVDLDPITKKVEYSLDDKINNNIGFKFINHSMKNMGYSVGLSHDDFSGLSTAVGVRFWIINSNFMMSIRYLIVFSIWLMGCAPYKLIDVPSENLNSRIDYIVLHATSQNFDESLNSLTKQSDYPVSSHYLIPHLDDESYDRNDLAVYRLVPEGGRAWHAGKSNWGDEVSLNDRSIGIEIVNEFSCTEHADITNTPTIDFLECQFLPYPKNQIALLIVLLQDILARHPEINPIDIVSHADIAPERKSDPGPYFPWQELYDAGIGAWYDEEDFEKHMKIFAFQLPEIPVIQQALSVLGYSVEETGEFDEQTRYALRAMQLHYRSTNYKGELDVESVAILFSLIEKYRVLEIDDLIN